PRDRGQDAPGAGSLLGRGRRMTGEDLATARRVVRGQAFEGAADLHAVDAHLDLAELGARLARRREAVACERQPRHADALEGPRVAPERDPDRTRAGLRGE